MAETQSIKRTYEVSVDGTAAVKALEKIAANTTDLNQKLSALGSTASKIGHTLAGVLALDKLGEAFSSSIEGIKAMSESFDQMGKDAQKIGVTIEDLQRFRYAASFSAVSAELLETSIKTLSVSMSKMGVTVDAASVILRKVGAHSGDSPLTAIERIADRFAKMPDGAEKAAEAVALFGRRGLEMIPWLNQGGKAIRELANEAERYGGIISQATAEQAGRFNDNLARLERTANGAKAQFVVGLAPAIDAIGKALADAVTKGDGFKEWGEHVGDVLIKIATTAISAGSWLSNFFIRYDTYQKSKGLSNAEVKRLLQEEDALLLKNQTDAKEAIDNLTKYYSKAREEAKKGIPAPPPPVTTGKSAEELAADMRKAQEDAQRGALEILKEDARIAKEEGDAAVKQNEAIVKAIDENVAALEDQKQAQVALDTVRQMGLQQRSPAEEHQVALTNKQTDAAIEYAQAQQDQIDNQAIWQQMLEDTAGATDSASKAMHEFAQKQIDASKTVTDEAKSFNDGWSRFVDSLSTGSVSVSQAFSAMAQSIIADLLKIWAKKYIIEALMNLFGGGATSAAAPAPAPIFSAFGNAFSKGRVVPMASGGILTSPVLAPMALMGEAGPEAVLPLRRGADGALGVAANGRSALNVAIHNYADAQVSARRDNSGDLQIIIEQTKRSIAADFRRGGNDISHAAESSWSLSRGTAAPF